MKNDMKITNMAMAKEYLQELGFQEKTGGQLQYRGWPEAKYLCWFDGKERKGAQAPTIVIEEPTGKICMHMGTTWYMREIPSILFKILEDLETNGILERGDD